MCVKQVPVTAAGNKARCGDWGSLGPDSCCCPEPRAERVTVCCCCDGAEKEICGLKPEGLGRIVTVDVHLKEVCPGKRLAVAVLLSEVDRCGREHNRGMKTFTIPAQPGPLCRDLVLRCVRFVVPEDLDVRGDPGSLCDCRSFRVRTLANYIDTDCVPCACCGTL